MNPRSSICFPRESSPRCSSTPSGFLALGKTPQVIWTIVDIVSGFWCIPNAIALLALSGVFMRIYRDYESKYISKTKPVSQPLEYVGKD